MLVAASISVLFNEPKLLKLTCMGCITTQGLHFSALQRAEIAEIIFPVSFPCWVSIFQCSSTSRNCWNYHGPGVYPYVFEFQCSSTSRNCWNRGLTRSSTSGMAFQCSSTSRNCWNRAPSSATASYCSTISVLFNEPKLLKLQLKSNIFTTAIISVLFNEPKLLKWLRC